MWPIVASEEQNSKEELLISFWYKIRIKLMNEKTMISKEKFLWKQKFQKCCKVTQSSFFSNSSRPNSKTPVQISVAARLRSLRSDDPLSKGHPRSMKQGLEL